MVIKYNIPIEVNKQQYYLLIKHFSGIIAHKNKNGKFWIKVWFMEYADQIQLILKKRNILKNKKEY